MAGAVAIASPPPVRTPEGGATDWPFQPLADCGNGNPFFYHMFADDFDPYRSTDYTVQGTVAQSTGDGGLILFTTGAVSGNPASIQHPNASFTLNSQPKKVFFECRLQEASLAANTINVGLIQTTATPVTVTDGVYFSIINGVIAINSANASVITTVTIPTAAYTLTVNTNIDLAFYINRLGDILAYVDTQLVGYMQQSQVGTVNNPQNAGAVARITAPSLTSAVLNPTLSITTTTALAKTMIADFFQAQKER